MKKSQIIKELRAKDVKSLTKELSLAQDKLVKLRSDLAFRKLKNIKEVMKTRDQ